jgi:hypothetical protein
MRSGIRKYVVLINGPFAGMSLIERKTVTVLREKSCTVLLLRIFLEVLD